MSTEQTNLTGPLYITQNGTYDTAYEAASFTWDENTEYDGELSVDGITLRYKKAEGFTVPEDPKYLASPAYSISGTMADGTTQSVPLSELSIGSADGVYVVNDMTFAVVWVKDAAYVNAGYGASLEDNTVYVTDFLWVIAGEEMAGVSLTLTAPGRELEGISSVTADIVTEPNLQYKYITENGSHYPDEGYDGLSDVYVNVPVPDGYLKPSGSYHIGANGTFNIAKYENVEVNIRNSGTRYIYENGTHYVDGYQYAEVQVDIPYGYVKPEGTLEITENGTYDVTNLKTITVRTPTPGALVKYRDGSIATVSAEQKAVLECAGLAMADDVSVALCGFDIDGKLYPAAEGMTWKQYSDSETYNTDRFFTGGRWVCSSENAEYLLGALPGNYSPMNHGLISERGSITIPGEYTWVKIPVGMSMGTLPKTEYAFGEELDITGGTVILHWQDGSSSEVPLSDVTVARNWNPDTFSGTGTVWVYTKAPAYRTGAYTSFSVTILPPDPFTIDGVAYPMPKIGTTWGEWVNSEANTAGIINDAWVVSADRSKKLYYGSTEVYTKDEIIVGGAYTWAASSRGQIRGIAVQKPPELLEYSSGSKLNTDGLRVTVTRADGSTYTVRAGDCFIGGFDSAYVRSPEEAVVESQVITVYYLGSTATFTITMTRLYAPEFTYALQWIAIASLPKTEYKLGESLDITGGVLAVGDAGHTGPYRYIPLTEDMVYGFDEITKPGKHVLLVGYHENGILCYAAYTITVTE